MKKYLVFFALISLVAFGCKQRAVTQPEAQQQTEQQKSQDKTGKPDMTREGQKPSENIVEKKSGADVASADKEGSKAAMEKEGMFSDVRFDFDKYDIKEEFKPTLKSVSSHMLKNNDARLLVEGHCDERGTNEYNLALGDRRAKAARDYLVSLGVASGRIDTLSYGEEKPLCSEQTEECWAKNRRAHFVLIGKAGK